MIKPSFEILNQKGTPMFYSDVYANIPTAGIVGRMFISTDTYAFYRDTGSGWDLIGGPGTGTITGSGATGQVSFFNGATTIGGSNNLFWDSANNRLGIGTATPGVPLDIHTTGTGLSINGTTTNNSFLTFQNAGTGKWRIGNNYSSGSNYFSIYSNSNSTEILSITNLGVTVLNGNFQATQLSVNGAAGTFRQLIYKTSGSQRWSLYASNTPETGINDGSNFVIVKYLDDGITSTPVFGLNRLTGNANFEYQVQIKDIPALSTAATTFLTSDSYTIKSRTAAQVLSDIGAASASSLSNYLPLTGGILTGNLTMSGANILLPANNVVSGTNYYLQQQMATNDTWKIYGNSVALDQGEMVLELQDNGAPIALGGQRFRFRFGADSDGTAKNGLIIDYNDSTFTTTITATINSLSTASNAFVVSDSGTLKYRTAANVLSDIAALPLAGGTLTGALNGTTATFSGNIIQSVGNSTLRLYGQSTISNSASDTGIYTVGMGDQNSAVRSYITFYQSFSGTYTDYLTKFTITKGGTGTIDWLSVNNNGQSTHKSSTFTSAIFNSTYGQSDINIQNNGSSFAVFGSGISVTSTAGASDVGIGTAGLANSIVFATGTGYTERFRVSAAGECIVGVTDQGAYNLQCNGTGVWGAGAYVNGSDIKLKENILPILSALKYVEKMNPVTFNYVESYSKDRSTQTGFIAQELKELFNDAIWVDGLVQKGKNHLNVAYQNIIPILTRAIQELKQEIDILKNKN